MSEEAKKAPEVPAFEIHISYDPKTGAMAVSTPSSPLVTLGLLSLAHASYLSRIGDVPAAGPAEKAPKIQTVHGMPAGLKGHRA